MKDLVKTVGVRVTPNQHKLLTTVCEHRGEHVTVFIRRAILKELASLSYFSDEQRKALGIQPEPVIDGNHLPLLTDKR